MIIFRHNINFEKKLQLEFQILLKLMSSHTIIICDIRLLPYSWLRSWWVCVLFFLGVLVRPLLLFFGILYLSAVCVEHRPKLQLMKFRSEVLAVLNVKCTCSCCLLHAGFMFPLQFDHEDGGDTLLRNVS
jgi:hypothetical protein